MHASCLRRVLAGGAPGPRLSLAFTNCPICRARMAHPALDDLFAPLRALEEAVGAKLDAQLTADGAPPLP